MWNSRIARAFAVQVFAIPALAVGLSENLILRAQAQPADQPGARSVAPAIPQLAEVAAQASPFLKAHCLKCHNEKKAEGDVRLDTLASDFGKNTALWRSVRNQVRDGLMPPPDEPRPAAADSRTLVLWISGYVRDPPPRLPNQGNLVPHELLFGKEAGPAAASSPRAWRLSPEGYLGFLRDVNRGRTETIVQPFTTISERGIADFAGLYAIDEPSTEVLLRNAAAIVEAQSAHEIKDGKVQGRNDTVREFVVLMDPELEPTREQLTAAIAVQFKMAIGRAPLPDELERYLALYEKCRQTSNRPAAVKTVLQAVLLRADAMYRMEWGAPQAAAGGRALLPPLDLARALGLALGYRRDAELTQAAAKNELATREQVAAQVRRLLGDPKAQQNARIFQFFREYFEYDKADDVFKDKPKEFVHAPATLISDTDKLVAHVLANDQDVFRQLLTTPVSFVNLRLAENKQTRKIDVPQQAVVLNVVNDKGKQGPEAVYGVAAWSPQQPMPMPDETRIGILMQPSWLVAWSTNFENDPVRRGRWVRERLLGGTVPDLPIGVAAQVPDEPHHTLRARLTVTRDALCWKCHQKMDELGLPFEQFDHFGRLRMAEPVLDDEATAKNVDKNGKPLGTVFREAPLNTQGEIAESGDSALDGPVRDPRDMIRKIANSHRARQVFIRHAFRFFLGRNETLGDARTLQEADAAYLASGGSFRELVVSLLTSEAFMYRQVETTAVPAP